MTFAAGTRLGPYEILAPLGAGGMGEVYRARDTRLGPRGRGQGPAVRGWPPRPRRASGWSERREPSRSSRTRTSARSTTSGVTGEAEYLVMELLEGDTLSGRLAKGALPLEQTLRIGVEIADALEQVRTGCGIVHRDLKPANVMVTRTDVKVLDFGLAKRGGTAARRGQPDRAPHPTRD